MSLRLLTRTQHPGPARLRLDSTPPRVGTGRRIIELAPGIWIVRYSQWRPASALDVHAELPVAVPTEVPKRVFPWPDWHRLAACRDAGDRLFFGDDPDERPTLRLSDLAKARAICAQCPVARTCLHWALTKPERFGIWGGTSGRQRDRMALQLEAGRSLDEVLDAWLNR